MTETHATAKYPPGRYGRRREPQPRRRWVVACLAALALVAGGAIVWRLYQQYGPQEYEPQVQRFYNVTDEGISVDFVVRKDAGKAATCRVRARSASGEEVGLAEVDVPKGAEPVVSYRLATSDRPVTVEVPACGPLRSR
ncbi:DUF4307 domain-containing protein [Dactylosporangium sp. AC04546]|uniref:DUF4307 domain-containing protein n=1 Tax=Dactylosporangium sp. AC04546 TaxID=2862460 RepID=UPI001EDDC641|nr:DUF4307 domain-containing protein [Dactylosporangium sp. AC04546]WVK83037.1 DUF4307 domain-containing protein [Dactylosporangium sp. AC04546]